MKSKILNKKRIVDLEKTYWEEPAKDGYELHDRLKYLENKYGEQKGYIEFEGQR